MKEIKEYKTIPNRKIAYSQPQRTQQVLAAAHNKDFSQQHYLVQNETTSRKQSEISRIKVE